MESSGAAVGVGRLSSGVLTVWSLERAVEDMETRKRVGAVAK
jgi:hypothetical protein